MGIKWPPLWYEKLSSHPLTKSKLRKVVSHLISTSYHSLSPLNGPSIDNRTLFDIKAGLWGHLVKEFGRKMLNSYIHVPLNSAFGVKMKLLKSQQSFLENSQATHFELYTCPMMISNDYKIFSSENPQRQRPC